MSCQQQQASRPGRTLLQEHLFSKKSSASLSSKPRKISRSLLPSASHGSATSSPPDAVCADDDYPAGCRHSPWQARVCCARSSRSILRRRSRTRTKRSSTQRETTTIAQPQPKAITAVVQNEGMLPQDFLNEALGSDLQRSSILAPKGLSGGADLQRAQAAGAVGPGGTSARGRVAQGCQLGPTQDRPRHSCLALSFRRLQGLCNTLRPLSPPALQV